jgi:hypothetical protein
MSNEIAKRIATVELSRHGFQVEPIPECPPDKSADLRVTGSNSKYLVETKDRLDNPEVDERRQEHFAAGKMFINSNPVTYDDNVCTALRDARKQLNATPKDPGTFQLIWFHGTPPDADHKYRRLFKTFYGHAWLSPPRGSESIHCLYFHFNLAYDMKDVEALILTHANEIQICLNEFADRADEFRKSELWQTYLPHGVAFDPRSAVASGEYITCTANISRKDSEAVLQALETQTGIRYRLTPTLKRYSFEIGEHGSEYPDELSIGE